MIIIVIKYFDNKYIEYEARINFTKKDGKNTMKYGHMV